MAIIQFKKKETVDIANGILGITISESLYRIENFEDRHNWYRAFFNINNAICFSRNDDNSETVIILDADKDTLTADTEVIFAKDGTDGEYIIPILDANIIPFGVIGDLGVVLDSMSKEKENNKCNMN